MSNEKIDNCEVSAHSPLGGYGMAENTGNGMLVRYDVLVGKEGMEIKRVS